MTLIDENEEAQYPFITGYHHAYSRLHFAYACAIIDIRQNLNYSSSYTVSHKTYFEKIVFLLRCSF